MRLREQCKVQKDTQRIDDYTTSSLKIESDTNLYLVLGGFKSVEVLQQLLKYHFCVTKGSMFESHERLTGL